MANTKKSKHYDGKDNLCIYCEAETLEDERHFISACCGRGMCEDCYGNLTGTDEQIHMDYYNEDEEDVEIIKRCDWENATYLCYDCYENWAYYATNLTN